VTGLSPLTRLTAVAAPAPSSRSDAAREAAQKLEATFLAEMLKSAGFGKSDEFAGGIGEEQFASFQTQALADEIVKSGGLGLAETFYQSMMETSNDA